MRFWAYFQNRQFHGRWPKSNNLETNEVSIAYMELYPIVIAAVIWGQEWTSKIILFHYDYKATHTFRSRIMKLLRRLTWCSVKYNLIVHAEFVYGKEYKKKLICFLDFRWMVSDARVRMHHHIYILPAAFCKITSSSW